ncbi:MAG TPA: lysoplasmalogenase [Candidatus Angelobacter sp.]|nr:lysoplasmalogenase [Candidatus Angelobacter sp.]
MIPSNRSGPDAPAGAVPTPRPLLAAYLVVAVVHVVAVAADLAVLAHLTKPLLVGLLLGWTLIATHRDPPGLLVAGLLAALAGDELLEPSGTPWFLAGMAAFLVMQVCYVAGFVRFGAAARLRANRWVPVGWGVLWVVLNLVLGPSLGALRVPILVYSAALVTMAAMAVATGDRRIGVGGVAFLVSDLLLGLGVAGLDLPASDVLVMTTYALAQYLIVTGWVLAVRTAAPSVAR